MDLRILNLYAGIGGNRFLWDQVTDIKVTAIEKNYQRALEYKRNFPQDTVYIENAHNFLLHNYQHYDFIWSSPPCQSHTNLNYVLHAQGHKRYPKLDELYGQIILLQKFAKNQLWIVENVKPFYDPLIPESFVMNRHYYWSNFPVDGNYSQSRFSITGMMNDRTRRKLKNGKFSPMEIADVRTLENYIGLKLSKDFRGDKLFKRVSLRNCVHPKDGKQILQSALGQITSQAKVDDYFKTVQLND